MNGKGSAPRNCFSEAYRNNYDSIFRTIGPEDCKKFIQEARRRKNPVAEQIKQRAKKNNN